MPTTLTNHPAFAQGEWRDSTATPAEDGSRFEGQEWLYPDYDFSTKALRSNAQKIMRWVKNDSGISMQVAKRPLRLDETGRLIKGFARLGTNAAGAEKCVVGDPRLGSTAIPNGSWCLVTVEGPELVKTGATGGAGTSISAGDRLAAQTSASSTAGSTQLAGVEKISSATSVLALDLLGSLGTAMSATTTDQTNTDTLVNVGVIN